MAERISRIDQPIFSSQFDWEPSSYADGVFGLGAPDSRQVLLSEDEDDERLIRYRPRTGSLSEHEDLLALKAQARAIQQLEERNTPLSGDEAGYDVSTAGSLSYTSDLNVRGYCRRNKERKRWSMRAVL